MKKVVVFGGGSGLSQIIKGLRLFPIDITCVVTVADNGTSTGRLRKDYNIPAVGDISKVMLAMADCNDDVKELMNYRFTKSKTLGNHSVKNLLLAALLDIKGDFNDAMPILEELLDVKGNILPLTEDNINLVGITDSNKKIVGEESVTASKDKIVKVEYDKKFKVNPKIYEALDECDLVLFSTGSLLTSITPHLVDNELVDRINKCNAKKMYICNLFTQPGETDGYSVSDHIKELEKYLGKNSIDVVIANNDIMDSELAKKYVYKEEKEPVILDKDKLGKMKVRVIEDKLYTIEDGVYRHDALKTAYLVFSYLMEKE